jgi:succinoglycan biosynthesis protein ExoM
MAGRTVIGVASYRRRRLLEALLKTLQAQAWPGLGAVEIVVVDNSPDHDLADFTPPAGPFPIEIVSEPEPGISAARNKALDLARARNAEFLAYIDDDELAEPDWLASLFAKQRETDADVVVGMVRGEPGPGAPAWMAAAAVFDTAPPDHDRHVGAGFSCNILFRLAAADGLRFSPDFGLTGGEDTLFFAQMHKNGATFTHALDAVVREPTAPERAKLSWLLRRWTREAISEGEVALRLNLTTRAKVLAQGAARFVGGAGLAVLMLPVSFGARFGRAAKYLRVAARGVGFMMSARRARILEYRR